MNNYKSLALVVCSVFISFCSSDPGETSVSTTDALKEISHPTVENIPPEADTIVPKLVQTGYFEQSLDSTRIAFSVGKNGLNIENEHLLGEISGIEKLDSFLVVLDSKQFQLRLYDFSGEMVAFKNIGGRGPGEVGLPRDVEIVDGLIYVFDDFYKVEVYEFRGGNFEYVRTHQLDYTPKKACHIGDKMIVTGFRQKDDSKGNLDAKLIHIHSLSDFKRNTSIVDPYIAKSPLAVRSLSVGQIACNVSDESVFFTFTNFPYVYNYSLDGQLKKTYNISSYYEMGRITEGSRDGSPLVRYGANSNNFFQSNFQLTLDDQNNLIINTHRSTTRTGDVERFRFLYKIDLNEDTIEFDERYLLEAIDIQITDELTVTSSMDPFPMIRVYRN